MDAIAAAPAACVLHCSLQAHKHDHYSYFAFSSLDLTTKYCTINSLPFSLCLYVSFFLSLSLSHTHTHTPASLCIQDAGLPGAFSSHWSRVYFLQDPTFISTNRPHRHQARVGYRSRRRPFIASPRGKQNRLAPLRARGAQSDGSHS